MVPLPAGAGAGGAFVRDDPGGPRPAGRDRRDRPGRRRDARPDDPRAGGREPALFAQHLNFADGPPGGRPGRPVLRRLARTSWPSGPTIWPREFEGRPGVLGVRKRLSMPAKDDFWKVRKAGFSLLMGTGRRRQADRLRRRHGRRSRRLPEFYDRFRADRRAPRGDGGLLRTCRRRLPAHPPDHQRQDARRRRQTLRSIAREVSDLVVEFGGAMSGEHGDGLARSLWNRKLFGPEVYACFQAVKRAFDPGEPAQSRQGRG